MQPALFGYPPGKVDVPARLPRGIPWGLAGPEALSGPVANALWVVHAEAIADFRAARGERLVTAIIWIPREGARVPDDWWTDFCAIVHEGDEEEERQLVRFARCPQAIVAGEAIEDIPEDWILGLAAPPSEADLPNLPEWLLGQYGEIIRTDPDCRVEVLERLRDRAAAVRLHLFPPASAVAAWLTDAVEDGAGGRSEQPASIEAMVRVSPYFRLLLQEQAALMLDAGLLDRDAARRKLGALGLDLPQTEPEARGVLAPAPPEWTGLTGVGSWLGAHLGEWLASAESAARTLAGLGATLARAWSGQGTLIPEFGQAKASPSAGGGGREGRPVDPGAQAAEFFRDHRFVRLRARDGDVTLTLSLAGDDALVVRIRGPRHTSPTRLIVRRAGDEVFRIHAHAEDDPALAEDETCSLMVLRSADLERLLSGGATDIELSH